jgi:hypothetical protein
MSLVGLVSAVFHILQIGAMIPDQQETKSGSPVGWEIHSLFLMPDPCDLQVDHMSCSADTASLQKRDGIAVARYLCSLGSIQSKLTSLPRLRIRGGLLLFPISTWYGARTQDGLPLCAGCVPTQDALQCVEGKNWTTLDIMQDLWFSLRVTVL